jgi:hypothetical protein
MPCNNQPFPASDDSTASLFIFDSMVIYLRSHSSFNCMWFHLILRDFFMLMWLTWFCCGSFMLTCYFHLSRHRCASDHYLSLPVCAYISLMRTAMSIQLSQVILIASCLLWLGCILTDLHGNFGLTWWTYDLHETTLKEEVTSLGLKTVGTEVELCTQYLTALRSMELEGMGQSYHHPYIYGLIHGHFC